MNPLPGTLGRVEASFFRFLEWLMVFLLAAMLAMVFGNVVLRWTVNSGIDVSEELSRYFFVWLTFIGAVVVMREHLHLGVDALVGKLGRRGRIACLMASDALILLCCAVFFWGTWQQQAVNASNISPVTGISMIWVFGDRLLHQRDDRPDGAAAARPRGPGQGHRPRARGVRGHVRARRSRARRAPGAGVSSP